jgi:hypothetical protein
MTESTDEFVYRSNIAILEKQLNGTVDAARRKMLSVILAEEHLKSGGERPRTEAYHDRLTVSVGDPASWERKGDAVGRL